MGMPLLRCGWMVAICIGFGLTRAASVASTCSTTLKPQTTDPAVAKDYVARLVANGLGYPRGIKFDNQGHLIVVEQYLGLTAITFEDDGGGCVIESSRKTILNDTLLNHGLELSPDGKTLYASSSEAAYSWDYDGSSQKNTSEPKTIVDNMYGSDHTTRTLLLSKKVPGMMVITRGSLDNIDPTAEVKSSGISQVKAFNLNKLDSGKTYDFDKDGTLLGWGLRNEVGVAEEPTKGGIYGVENSADDVERDGVDIHNTNPAEEMNFLGYLDGTQSSNQGRNFGYPQCLTAWDTDTINGFKGKSGDQFAIGDFNKNSSKGDSMCDEAHVQRPRIHFHPHMAPLDLLFNDDGSAGWVTFHGSWDSDTPVGYKVSVVEFEDGEPRADYTTKNVEIDIFQNNDLEACYAADYCIRPVSLDWDSKGRLFMSSDFTGEIWMILRADGKATSSTQGAPGPLKHSGNESGAGAMGMSILAFITAVIAFVL